MNNFYKARQKKFQEKYWKEQTPDLTNVNGFSVYPTDMYNNFLEYIQHDGNVLDLGCGNGLLLKHLVNNSNRKVIPFGVDFLEQSISQAKKDILPEFSDNFYICSIDKFFTNTKFQYIIFEPYLVNEEDRTVIVEKLKDFLEPGGRIIVYTYHDALKNENIKDIFHYPGLEDCRFQKYNRFDVGMDIAYIVNC